MKHQGSFPLLVKLACLTIVACTLVSANAVAASADAFDEQLKSHGWTVMNDGSGNRYLYPPKREAGTDPEDRTSAAAPASTGETTQAPTEAANEHSPSVPAPPPMLDDEAVATLIELGWSVDRTKDGSLYLYPPTDDAIDGTLAAEPVESSRATFRIMDDNTIEELRSHGWTVELDHDGSVLLYPPEASESSPEPSPQERLDEPASEDMTEASASTAQEKESSIAEPSAPVPAPAASPAMTDPEMLEALEHNGWTVETAPDGSVLLYPPSYTPPSIDPEDEPLPGHCDGSAPASVAEGVVELPVDTWEEVHAIAEAWVKDSGNTGLAVGRIRHVFRVHVVSIIDAAYPHELRHQIAVRRSDGHVILLD